jgi:hypothetical protein
MRSRVLFAALLTTALACINNGVAKADTTETAKQESVSVFGEANLQVPADFKRVAPANRIIAHEFQATAGDGDKAETARVTMMAAGGDVAANIKRWEQQFTGGEEAAQKSEEMKLGEWNVHIVDASGSYAERMGGGPFAGGKVVNRENYAMAGAILVHPDGKKYFVKMIGPAKVVKANREAFVKMIKSIQQ